MLKLGAISPIVKTHHSQEEFFFESRPSAYLLKLFNKIQRYD